MTWLKASQHKTSGKRMYSIFDRNKETVNGYETGDKGQVLRGMN
jgi:hypothetical protein